MGNRNGQNKYTHAARRSPNDIHRQPSQAPRSDAPFVSRGQNRYSSEQSASRPQNRQNPQNPQNRQNSQNRQNNRVDPRSYQAGGNGYRVTSGIRRADYPASRSMMTQKSAVTLSPEAERRIERRENREKNQAIKEKEWQKDVVRVSGRVDYIMLGIILLLLALGTVAVFSASYPFAIAKNLGSNYFIKQQIIYLLIGGVAMLFMTFLPVKFYRNWAPFIGYAISAVLLIAVLFIGSSEGEATRWIRFGSFGIQPSELMKLSIVLILAWYAQTYEDRMKELDLGFTSYKWNTLYPLCILGVACFLVLIGKHLSGTVIVGGIGFLVLLVAGCKPLWLVGTGAAVGIPAIAAYLAMNPYALKRITTFTDENADKLDELYQTTQSIYAIGNGGVAGVGLGESIQKHSYLSAAHTDFIFSIWCEEWGFIGAVALVLLFMLFMWRGYLIAVRAPDKFTMLTAFGITTQVGLQALLNMMVASDIIMNTGVSLPFFSYGGTSTVILLGEMGVLLEISRNSYQRK